MTKHIRKEHPAESLYEDQDAEYSDVEQSDDEGIEDESDEIKEEPQNNYQDAMEVKPNMGQPSQYNRNLWGLPGQTTHRPSPIDTGSNMQRSDSAIQEIKLERTSSSTPQRSQTSPYPGDHMDFSISRSQTMPDSISIPTSVPQPNSVLPQQFQLRNTENGIWSAQHALQNSPTSLSHSSPSSASTQGHPLYTSQPFQLDVSPHESMQYSHHDNLVTGTIPVHEIRLDDDPQQPFPQAPTPVHQFPYDAGIREILHQDPYNTMSRDVTHQYDEATSRPVVNQDSYEMPSTPASNQQLSNYPMSLNEVPSQQLQLNDINNYSVSNQVYPPNNAMYQYNDATSDWIKDTKLEQNGWILPAQRVADYNNWAI